jgi:branched-subunit amino acid transport protein AzlD
LLREEGECVTDNKKNNSCISYLGNVLPYSAIGMLVVPARQAKTQSLNIGVYIHESSHFNYVYGA